MKIKKFTLLVTMLAMFLGTGSYAVAQVAPEPAAQEPAPQQPVPDVSCEEVFREEQSELADTGVYPTSVSDQPRAIEDSGFENPFPAPN